jgi:hypothetical protein
VANLVLAAVTAGLVWDICLKLTDRRTANLATTVLVGVFLFGHLTPLGNYNFVTPYSHEATHGTLLCVATVWGLVRWIRTGSRTALAIGGVATGAAWLTKPEIALAATAILLTGTLLGVRILPDSRRFSLYILASALLFPAAVIGIAVAWTLGPTTVPDVLARPFASAALSHPLSETFYLEGMGLDHPFRNTAWILLAGGLSIAVCMGLAAATRRIPPGFWSWTAALALGPMAGLVTVASGQWRLWLLAGWTLPATCLFAIAWLRADRSRHPGSAAKRVGLAVWIVFSMTFLLKLGLRPRLYQYGFYLAFPATILAVMLAVHFGPRWLESRGSHPGFVRGVAVGFTYSLSAVLVLASIQAMHRRTASVMDGRDLLHVRPAETDPRTGTVLEVMSRLPPLIALDPRLTLTVVPEGASLNYWLRIDGGSRYPVLLPPEMSAFGKRRILSDFREDPPRIIVAIDRDMSEYGLPDVRPVPGATSLSRWINQSYCEVARVRAVSSQKQPHGASILMMKTASSCLE